MKEERIFTEQAEYISKDEFMNLSSDHPKEIEILQKLKQRGAKLITGPRGCGKTTLLLKAYYSLIPDSTTVPLYINFKTSLKLEPVYRSRSNGTYWFTYWMYLKIVDGINKYINDYEVYNCTEKIKYTPPLSKNDLSLLLDKLELGEIEYVEQHSIDLDITKIQSLISELLVELKRKKCVIYFDDAAHAFSSDQQRDFFELFRKIKNKDIFPKAAVYPGVTNFSPTFNIGHDAEEINVWLNPQDESYAPFMYSILKKRIPDVDYNYLLSHKDHLDILVYSAFGIPRQFLNMVRSLYNGESLDISAKKVKGVVSNSYESTLKVYNSLKTKMPPYQFFVDYGNTIFKEMINAVKKFNSDTNLDSKVLMIAIKKDISPDLQINLGFFEYAGLVASKGEVSRGGDDNFALYLINIGALVSNNAVIAKKGTNYANLAKALNENSTGDYVRLSSSKLSTEEIKLKLPPCSKCNTERINEAARFCHNCGNKLKEESIYRTLIKADISMLNLTKTRIQSIKKAGINTVEDILFDIGNTKLKSVPQVGQHWIKKIITLAEEYIS